MRIRFLGSIVLALVIAGASAGNLRLAAQQDRSPAAPPRNPSTVNMPLASLNDLFIRFPLAPGQESYAGFDGRHMHQYVVDQAQISRKSGDAGHARFRSRIVDPPVREDHRRSEQAAAQRVPATGGAGADLGSWRSMTR